jgi:hypothetical protein
MAETLGQEKINVGSSMFSFKDNAEALANDLINSLVIDVEVNLDFAFGLDLSNLFDTIIPMVKRVPESFIEINMFDISGLLGVNEWSTSSLDIGDFSLSITEAKALVEISSKIPSPPLVIHSPTMITDISAIVFSARLDVVLPVFIVFGEVGAGARIEYR